ncbi:DUF3551 domain-containing protein [Bradyrhizobium sp. INPA01-394B]|uniref:DUF3551 domain-containing protein n=1 Tax=Bradyrhizobium campsiandrae TaxID=1729892 RepID=A0ABR7U3J8_9BRAD|nr:DUF3551 domain-containing protein [Bradyrhizobium campsiandrae]MBC9883104.1 DUF3551 domain-containing protein [Bradyrhizobium campsiandrae]MBC9978066.1 DUF3551 domain-containing protein [Bradyrhizobium campsiandrae]
MHRIFAVAAVVAALAAATAPETPAAAKGYLFCQLDYDSGMRRCAFETIDRCLAAIAGRGGSCSRNPASEANASLAHGPKMHARKNEMRLR